MIMGHVWFGAVFDKWIHGFHMPLWFMISGYFLNTKRDTGTYIKRKVKAIIVPYFFFAVCYELIWTVADHNQWMGIVWPNSIEIPLNGALWFLPALLVVNVGGFLSVKYLKKEMAYIVLAALAIVGSLNLISLPFALDSALVGCGFFLIGYIIRQYGKKLTEIRLPMALVVFGISSALIFVNGTVNMRTNEYAIIPLFWISAVMATVALWSICKWIDTEVKKEGTLSKMRPTVDIMKTIGSDSLIYVCTNQFILFFLKRLPILEVNILAVLVWHILELIIIILACYVMNKIISKSPLHFFILGK